MKDWLLHVAIEKDEKMATPTMAVTNWPCTANWRHRIHPELLLPVWRTNASSSFFFDLRFRHGLRKGHRGTGS